MQVQELIALLQQAKPTAIVRICSSASAEWDILSVYTDTPNENEEISRKGRELFIDIGPGREED